MAGVSIVVGGEQRKMCRTPQDRLYLGTYVEYTAAYTRLVAASHP